MEIIDLSCSLKDIPIPDEETFMKLLIAKTNSFIRRVRWKVYFAVNGTKKEVNMNKKEGENEMKKLFKSMKNPPNNPDLENFEKGLLNIIKNLKFKQNSAPGDKYLKELAGRIKSLKEYPGYLIHSDKTGNLYSIKEEEYKKLIYKELNKDYKKCSEDKLRSINDKGYQIVKDYEIDDRTEPFRPKMPRITLKDHKQGFLENPTVRLINPSKTDIGKISKSILDRILPGLRDLIRLTQWRNSDSVIDWFERIEEKNNINFIQCDIVSYYPSITFGLLNKSLLFARKNSDLNRKEMEVIREARRSVISYNSEYWSRKDRPNEMDITIGAGDSAEITDLVGIYLLWKLGEEFPNIGGGLYRDDILLTVLKHSKVEIERKTKALRNFFGREGLKITVERNHKTINFLDVTLELGTGKFGPFHKDNENLKYVNRRSNHPKAVIKSLVKSISNRISKLSADEKIFKKNESYYNEALKRAGYDEKIEYLDNIRIKLKDNPRYNKVRGGNRINNNRDKNEKMNDLIKDKWVNSENNINNKKRGRKRRIVWFNPPYNANLKSNVAKEFFKLLEISFPKEHKFNKIINKHTIKLSYSTTPNLENIIAGINGAKFKKIGNEINKGNLKLSMNNNVDEEIINLDQMNNIIKGKDIGNQKGKTIILEGTNQEEEMGTKGNNKEETSTKELLVISRERNDNNYMDIEVEKKKIDLPIGMGDGNRKMNTPKVNRNKKKGMKIGTQIIDYEKCNCRSRKDCPLQNKCLTENLVYVALVKSGKDIYKYIGATSNSFKKGWYNHTRSFRDPALKKVTSLAKLIHNLKDNNKKYEISWEIIKGAKPYNGGGGVCNLCLLETYKIMTGGPYLINLHEEAIMKCMHRKKWSFGNYA